jgi:hypothetical protein
MGDRQSMNKPSEKRFTETYDAYVTTTGRKIARYPERSYMMTFMSADEDAPNVTSVPIMSIELPQDKYERFLSDYQNYLDIMDQLRDPIFRQEYYKLLVLAKLKK